MLTRNPMPNLAMRRELRFAWKNAGNMPAWQAGNPLHGGFAAPPPSPNFKLFAVTNFLQ
jgi:hypothetical protein